MQKKMAFYVCAVLLAFPISLFLHVLLATPQGPTAGVTRENFLRLHEGMTEQEVENVMGRPAMYRLQSTGSCTLIWRGEGVTVGIDYAGEDAAFGGVLICGDGSKIELKRKPELAESPVTIILRNLGFK